MNAPEPDPRQQLPSLRAIVVDDEPLARVGLARDLIALGLDVVAVCDNGHAACDAIATHRPDLLFLDIEMPEVDGFAVLEAFEPEELPPAIIFVTAYDQHAIRAFEIRALDYLLKPFAPARLRDAVERATQRVQEAHGARARADAAGHLPRQGDDGSPSYLTQLLVRDRDQVMVVPVHDLEWVQAESYYVRLHAAKQRPRLLRQRMSVLEARLDPSQFFRAHRSAIVRIDLVRVIIAVSRYEYILTLSTGATVPLSRDRRARLETLLAEPRATRSD